MHNLQKLFSIWVQSAKWRNIFSGQQVWVPLSICVICANCTICKSCFQFECNMQNEEVSFQIYSLEDRTLINLCNFCQIAVFAKAVFNLSAICKMKKCFFRSTSWRTVIKLCNLCKLHHLQKLFSTWVQSAKWRNDFSDLLVGGSYPYQFV